MKEKAMKKLRPSLLAAALGGAALALSGCHSPSAGPVPIPAPSAAPSPAAQIQEIENNPHIPPAQKASLEAGISSRSGATAPSPPPAPP